MDLFLRVQTTLDSDSEPAFQLASVSGEETVSKPFRFHLDLVSQEKQILPEELIGRRVTFFFEDSRAEEGRVFNGYINRLSLGDWDSRVRHYNATVVPWFWFLNCCSDCRIFQGQTVQEIVESVFGEYDFAEYEFKSLQGSYRTWKYCVQYNETDFHFVSRLLEQEGLFYWFEHSESGHTMQIGDHSSHYNEIPDKQVRHEQSSQGGYESLRDDGVWDWEHRYTFIPSVQTITDYNYEQNPSRTAATPANLLLKTLKSQVELPAHAEKLQDGEEKTEYEIFQYPGEFELAAEGDELIKVRVEDDEVEYSIAGGTSGRKSFAAGYRFVLVDHDCEEENREYYIVSVQHRATDPAVAAEAGGEYTNTFSCVPAEMNYRPDCTVPKPVIQGSQTAVVVGPEGSEINADALGRVQVQFFWDRYGKRTEDTTCWIRCSQTIAGKNWGALFTPRVGQEVVVTFLDGDPDRPLITGVVYNAEQEPPYDLSSEPTKSCIKTNSSPDGEGYNELCFDDKKDKELLYLHAQRNMDVRVLNDSATRIFGNRSQIIGWEKDGEKGGDQKELVYQDKHLNIKRNQVEHIEGNYELMIGNGDAEEGGKLDVVVENKKTESIGADGYDLAIEGDRKEKVGGAVSLTVTGDHNEACDGSYALESGGSIHIKGMSIVIEADSQLSLKVGGNFVDISSASVAIKGSTVLINSGGSAGSGSGASADEPEEPAEAEPTEPELAHKDKSGQKSAPDELS